MVIHRESIWILYDSMGFNGDLEEFMAISKVFDGDIW
jgi:hypothetical protein